MDQDDSLEESQGSRRTVKGKRGVIWGNAETSALIKIWGEAEIKYALSSLKRNYKIFEMISSELIKIRFNRTAEECRTKTKSSRKRYKQVVVQNNTSGSRRAKFIWFDEMAQIFRTDTSIHPLRTTESKSAPEIGAETMEADGDEVVTLDLFESNNFLLSAGSDVSGPDTHSTDVCKPSTSGCSTALSTAPSTAETSRRKDPGETTSYEETLDPARRLAMLQKRKQRASAAARLDNTLSGFVNWVQKNTESNNLKRNARDEEEKRFHNEVISNLRVASRSLMKLTDYITSSSCDCSGNCSKKCVSDEVKKGGCKKSKAVKCRNAGNAASKTNFNAAVSDSDSDSVHKQVSDNETDSELEAGCSQSLL